MGEIGNRVKSETEATRRTAEIGIANQRQGGFSYLSTEENE